MSKNQFPEIFDPSAGFQLLKIGAFDQALVSAEQALAIQAEHTAWLSIKAVALSELRQAERALPVYEQLTRLQPRHAAHWSNLGNCLCELGRERLALEPLIQAMLLGAQDAALYYGLARAYSVVGPMSLALRHINQAIENVPQDSEFQLLRVRILSALDQWDEAQEGISNVKRLSLDESQKNELGYLLLRGQWFQEAMDVFSEPVQSSHLQADQTIGLIMCLERINKLDEIAPLLARLDEQEIRSNPKLYENYLQMQAKLAHRAKKYQQAIDNLIALQGNEHLDTGMRASLSFDLSAAYDKCGQVEKSMSALHEAHKLSKSIIDRDHPSIRGHAGILTVLDEPIPELPKLLGLPEDGQADPVFVVGFPRSGTTLLEQLLDAHTELVSFDEQPLVQRIIQRLFATGESIDQAALHLNIPAIVDIRAAYYASVQNLTKGLQGRQAVDKNPLNMIRLPLLQNIFPRAQVILAVRHPCDVVLSCYMQHFKAPAFAVTFETLESTAEMYDKVFSRWYGNVHKFSWPVLEWKYEDLVADTEGRARALFEFLNLPWQNDLLAFTERAKRKGIINTPSYTQVVEQVNARAVGRWQAYEAYFTPAVMRHLNPWLERFGYLA